MLISSISTTNVRDVSDVPDLIYSPGNSISYSEHDSSTSEDDWKQILLASSESVTNDNRANNDYTTVRPKREALRSNIQLKKESKAYK